MKQLYILRMMQEAAYHHENLKKSTDKQHLSQENGDSDSDDKLQSNDISESNLNYLIKRV